MKNQAFLPKENEPTGTLADDLGELAAALAKELVPQEVVAAKYGLSEAEMKALLSDSDFQNLLRQEKAVWLSPENTAERVRIKSMMAVEAGMLSMAAITNDPEIGPVARIKAFAELIRTGGADQVAIARAHRGSESLTDRFSIAIHIGSVDGGEIRLASIDGETGETNVTGFTGAGETNVPGFTGDVSPNPPDPKELILTEVDLTEGTPIEPPLPLGPPDTNW